MHKLKKFLLTAYCLISLVILNAPYHFVSASSENYARVLQENVFIYQDANFNEPLFAIPYGYYVKIESNEGALKVSYGDGDYPKIFGYVKEEEISKVDYAPSSPFTVIKVSTDISDILFNDLELKTPYFNVPKNEILYYYGEIEKGDRILCYVYYNKKLGYVDKSSLNSFSIPTNPDKLPTQEQPETPIEEESVSTTVNPFGEHIQVAIIVGISIVAISVVYFLFKPSKHRTEEERN